MSTQATAIYENGVLRLLTPVSLPERARVRIQILGDQDVGDDMRRAEAILVASGLVKPLSPIDEITPISRERRTELAHLYASGGPLSETIIAERDGR